MFNFVFCLFRGLADKYEMGENIYVPCFSVMHIFSESANCPLSPSLKCSTMHQRRLLPYDSIVYLYALP